MPLAGPEMALESILTVVDKVWVGGHFLANRASWGFQTQSPQEHVTTKVP